MGLPLLPTWRASKLRARRILEETTVRTGSEKFETGLLWNQNSINFLDNRPMAERRLRYLERRLASDPNLYDNVVVARRLLIESLYSRSNREMSFSDMRRT